MNSKVILTTLVILLGHSISQASSIIELVCSNKSNSAKIQNLAVSVEADHNNNLYYLTARPDHCFTLGNKMTQDQYSDMLNKTAAVSVSATLNCTNSPLSTDASSAVLSVSADLTEAALTTNKNQDLFECSEKSKLRKKFEDFLRGIGPQFGS